MTDESLSFPACYVCGSANDRGLHVRFERGPDGGSVTRYTARAEHVGWPDVIHGGLLFTLMDEAVAWAVIYAGQHAVTARAETRFRSPARVGTPLVVRGSIVESSRRMIRTHAEIREAEGEVVVAELDAVMVPGVVS